jgi:hypothetical protein
MKNMFASPVVSGTKQYMLTEPEEFIDTLIDHLWMGLDAQE